MTAVQIEAAQLAIKRMMKIGHVNICTVREILEMTGGIPDKSDFQALALLHCVDFKDYSQRMRMELPMLLERVLTSPTMEVNIRFTPLTRPVNLITLEGN